MINFNTLVLKHRKKGSRNHFFGDEIYEISHADYFLIKNDVYKIQSGFRNKKGAGDKLAFFTQKISETLNKGKKACGIFFDISKASIKFGIWVLYTS